MSAMATSIVQKHAEKPPKYIFFYQIKEHMSSSTDSAKETPNVTEIFNRHYNEFCKELMETCPEYTNTISAAHALDRATRIRRFKAEVVPGASPLRVGTSNPGTVLPGVIICDSIWSSLGNGSQKAIQEYITVLTFCTLYEDAGGLFHGKDGAAKLDGFDFSTFAETMMGSMKDKMAGFNISGLSEKIQKMIESQSENFKKLPERLLKGQLGKLIMEIIGEVKPEDFGITPDDIAACESNPGSAFELVGKLYSQNPQNLQSCMMRIVKKLQSKFATGQFKVETMAAEAEEFIKEFADNPALVELMETFRNTFGMMDMDTAKAVGREGEARRNIVRERLRAKLEKRKGGK
jgi:hypothetical protein